MSDALLKNILRAVEPFRLVKEPGVRGRTAVGVTVRPPPPSTILDSFLDPMALGAHSVAMLHHRRNPGRLFLSEVAGCSCRTRSVGATARFASISELEAFLNRYPNGANAAAHGRASQACVTNRRAIGSRASATGKGRRLAQKKPAPKPRNADGLRRSSCSQGQTEADAARRAERRRREVAARRARRRDGPAPGKADQGTRSWSSGRYPRPNQA